MADHSCQHANLDELLADPITVLIMQSDGVDPDDVRLLFRKSVAAGQARSEELRPN